jgi:hypothetical protein
MSAEWAVVTGKRPSNNGSMAQTEEITLRISPELRGSCEFVESSPLSCCGILTDREIFDPAKTENRFTARF